MEQLEVRRNLIKDRIRKERELKKEQQRQEENSPLLQYRLMCNGFLFILFIVVFGILAGLILQTNFSFFASSSLEHELVDH